MESLQWRMLATRTALLVTAIVAVAVSVIAVVAPLFHPGFPAGHDAGAHLTYTHLFDRAFRAGQVPVRWVELPGGGRSQPLFNYYQPGFYYFVSLTHLLVPSLQASLKWTIAGLWWLGTAFTFLWLKRDRAIAAGMPAAFGALLFACAPYLILDVFVRAAYPEMAAIAFAPAVLWAIDRFLRTQALPYALALAICFGIMLVCHLPSVLICTPAFVIYACCVPRRGSRSLVVLAAAAIVGCGLAAFYVVPALGEIDAIAMSQLTSGYFDYHQHFVYPRQWVRYTWGYGGSIAGADDPMSLQIGPLQWVVLVGSMAVLVVRRAMTRKTLLVDIGLVEVGLVEVGLETERVMWGWLAVAGLAMFLMTSASTIVWEWFPPLAYIQFPWRFLMLIALASAALAASLLSQLPELSQLPQPSRKRYAPIAQAIVVLAAAMILWPLARPQSQPVRYMPWTDYPIDDSSWATSERAAANAFIEAGYSPRGVTRFPSSTVGRWMVSGGEGTVREIGVATDDRLQLSTRSPGGLHLTITSHAFPGWKVWVDRKEAPFQVEPGTGYLLVEIPAGTHHVEARLTNTPIRTAANAISLASVALLAATGASHAYGVVTRTRMLRRGRQLG